MEREVIFCPKWHSALWFLLLMILCFSCATKAEITCRSCQQGNKWRGQELLLKFEPSESAPGLRGEVFGLGAGTGAASAESRRLRCAEGSDECAPERAKYAEPRMKRNTGNLQENGETGESEFANMKVSGVKMGDQPKSSGGAASTSAASYRGRARRNSDDEEKVRRPGSAQSPNTGEVVSSVAGRRATRSELRWSGEERRAAAPRQEELKLNSSMFALTGDSSHNQAMVHWSGQNSSVSEFVVSTLRKRCALMLTDRSANSSQTCVRC